MTNQEALDYLLSIPMFQQAGGAAMKPGTERIERLCEALGNPQRRIRAVHIAGTNGKGSTAHLLCSILMAAGYRTGLFTSPHLHDFRERIRIDGQMITPEEVTAFVERAYEEIKRTDASFFEVTTAMAFDCFARHETDIAVIETGLGGRIDATNIITPTVSVITNIGYDHTDLLGDTLEQIAREKAGIIKPGVPVVIGETRPETAAVFIQKARELQASLTFADRRFACLSASLKENAQEFLLQSLTNGYRFRLESDLYGAYQQKNILTVLAAAEALQDAGIEISRRAVEEGTARCAAATGLQGRWQILSRHPYVVCDTGHNENGLAQTTRQIASCRYGKLYMILGFVRDKDLTRIWPLLPQEAEYLFTRPSCPRGLDEKALQSEAGEHGLRGGTAPDVNRAIAETAAKAGPEDMVYIGGSTYLVADIASEGWPVKR